MSNATIIRQWRTKNFTVTVDATEDYDVDLSWDDDGSIRHGLESGEFVSFAVRASVIHRATGAELASDYLGGCIYRNIGEFQDHRECGKENRKLAAKGEYRRCGSYFVDMVKTVCHDARQQLNALQGIHMRHCR